ncbi:flagellar protein FlaG [Oceanobacillus saliphilus]|uniref:flagellar protein FlaG n=1 Tax=Oceanobacillus saliphilus TaxID=2925834 RepID=UPI00201D947B|nr:flagellar protein FlaG [Oceanobacillus saliphilus]
MTVDGVLSGSQTSLNSEYSMKSTTAAESMEVKTEHKMLTEQLKNGTMENKENLEMAISKFNDFIEPLRRNLKFELHDRLDKYYVTVIDSSTNEVIKEIPPKKMLDMYAEMADFMGFLIDKKI